MLDRLLGQIKIVARRAEEGRVLLEVVSYEGARVDIEVFGLKSDSPEEVQKASRQIVEGLTSELEKRVGELLLRALKS